MTAMKNLLRISAILSACLIISACGKKGPLIVDRPPEDFIRTQEGLPNEISPDDGSDSESEAIIEVESEESNDE